MGTRSLIRVMDEDKTLVCMYRQMDGYPTGIGADIKKILGNPEIVNGYQMGQKCPEFFNGMGCLAAYLIGKLKGDEIGSIYIMGWGDPGTEEAGWAEYFYTIYTKKIGHVYLKCQDSDGKVLYDGTIAKFNPKKVEKDAMDAADAEQDKKATY